MYYASVSWMQKNLHEQEKSTQHVSTVQREVERKLHYMRVAIAMLEHGGNSTTEIDSLVLERALQKANRKLMEKEETHMYEK